MNQNIRELGGWKHARLHARVVDVIETIDKGLQPATRLDGVSAADLHKMTMQATLEELATAALNDRRPDWDPTNEYASYSFIHHPAAFPAVRLCSELGSDDVIMGIDLSGWFVLAEECSARFYGTDDVCSNQDLVMVLPWALAQGTHGNMVVFSPFVASAKVVAAARNEHWLRGGRTERRIDSPVGVKPYPKRAKGIDDRPVPSDSNFGRIARTGLMKDYIDKTMQLVLQGRTIEEWVGDYRVGRSDVTPTPPPVSVS